MNLLIWSNCMFGLFLIVLIRGALSSVLQYTKNSALSPVVFIPGDGGNMLEARVDMKDSQNSECPKHRDWFRIWLNLKELLPVNLPCQVETFQLLFDSKTNTSYNVVGVETRIPGFGNTHTVEYVDDSWEAYLLGDIGACAYKLVRALTSQGLVRNVSIRGAPYDFRLAMASQKDYFDRLRQLVEDTYKANKNVKVALVTHSMGGVYTTWFLNHQSQAWKDQFIDCLITLSTPWGGSSESLQAIVSGFTFHHSIIFNPLVTRQEQRTFETSFLLLPNSKVWSENEYLIYTDQKNFTASRKDLHDLFHLIGVSNAIYDYVWDTNIVGNAVLPTHPGVKTFCIYGTQVLTNHILDFRGKKFPDEQPKMISISGDGTAAHSSLSLCQNWNLGPNGVIEIPFAHHNDVLWGSKGVNAVINILMNQK